MLTSSRRASESGCSPWPPSTPGRPYGPSRPRRPRRPAGHAGQPATGPTGFTAASPLKFRQQEIAKDFGVGYAVAAADVNGDKKTDILAISGTELVWFQAPNWEKTVILPAGATTADNVTLAPHDIDGDGRLDVALGAGWTRQNTGTLQWVRQNAPGTTPAWEVLPDLRRADAASHQVGRHRRRQKARADRRAAARQGHHQRPGPRRAPAGLQDHRRIPRRIPWPMEVAGEANHIQHNFLAMNFDGDPQDELVTASVEGLTSWKRAKDGTWARTVIGEGSPGEVKLGRVGGRRLLATVEPWHGAGVAVYAEKPGAPLWTQNHDRNRPHRGACARLGRFRRRRQRRAGGRLAPREDPVSRSISSTATARSRRR